MNCASTSIKLISDRIIVAFISCAHIQSRWTANSELPIHDINNNSRKHQPTPQIHSFPTIFNHRKWRRSAEKRRKIFPSQFVHLEHRITSAHSIDLESPRLHITSHHRIYSIFILCIDFPVLLYMFTLAWDLQVFNLRDFLWKHFFFLLATFPIFLPSASECSLIFVTLEVGMMMNRWTELTTMNFYSIFFLPLHIDVSQMIFASSELVD